MFVFNVSITYFAREILNIVGHTVHKRRVLIVNTKDSTASDAFIQSHSRSSLTWKDKHMEQIPTEPRQSTTKAPTGREIFVRQRLTITITSREEGEEIFSRQMKTVAPDGDVRRLHSAD